MPTAQPSKPVAAAERVVSGQNAAPAQGPAKPPTLSQPLSQPAMRDAQQSKAQGPQAPPQLRSQNITSPIPDKAPQLPSPVPQKAPYGYPQQRQPQQDMAFRGPPSQGGPPQQYQAPAPQKYQAAPSQQYQAPPPQQFQAPAPQYQAAAAQAAMQNGNYGGSYNKSSYNSQPQQPQQQSQYSRSGTNGTYASQDRQVAPQAQPRSVAPPARRVFGQSLDALFRRDELPVPLVVSQCIQAVDLFGLQVEGIYRTSGNQAHITQLKQIFDTGKLPKIYTGVIWLIQQYRLITS